MEPVTLRVMGVFSTAVTHALVHIPPLWQDRINHLLVRIVHRAGFDRGLDERSDGLVLYVLQQDDSDLATALNPSPRSAALPSRGCPDRVYPGAADNVERVPGSDRACPLWPTTTYPSSHSSTPHGRTALDDTTAQWLGHRLAVACSQVELRGNLPIR